MLARHYAHALCELTDGQTGKDVSEVVRSFVQLLAKKGHTSLLPAIVREYEKVRAGAEKRNRVSVSVASAREESSAKKYVAELPECAHKEVVVSVDPNLISGFRIEGGDILFDGSGRRKLVDLYKSLIS